MIMTYVEFLTSGAHLVAVIVICMSICSRFLLIGRLRESSHYFLSAVSYALHTVTSFRFLLLLENATIVAEMRNVGTCIHNRLDEAQVGETIQVFT